MFPFLFSHTLENKETQPIFFQKGSAISIIWWSFVCPWLSEEEKNPTKIVCCSLEIHQPTKSHNLYSWSTQITKEWIPTRHEIKHTVVSEKNSCQNCQWHHVSICGKLPWWAKRPIRQQQTGRSEDACTPVGKNKCGFFHCSYLSFCFINYKCDVTKQRPDVQSVNSEDLALLKFSIFIGFQ